VLVFRWLMQLGVPLGAFVPIGTDAAWLGALRVVPMMSAGSAAQAEDEEVLLLLPVIPAVLDVDAFL
jgi:hypothetical protein